MDLMRYPHWLLKKQNLQDKKQKKVNIVVSFAWCAGSKGPWSSTVVTDFIVTGCRLIVETLHKLLRWA